MKRPAGQERYLERGLRLWLLAALLPALILLAPFLPGWAIPACVIVLAARGLRPGLRRGPVGHMITVLLAVAAVSAVVLHYHTVLGRDAGVTLLLLFTTLKLFETETLRDGRIAALLTLLSTNAVFLFDQSLWRALVAAGAFLVQVGSLIELSAPGEPVPVRRRLAEAAGMTLLAIPFMLVLFVLFPRISGPLWEVPRENSARSGLSDEMDPGAISRLVRDDSPAFRVRFSGSPPPAHLRYWRGPVMSTFDGRRWRVADADRRPAIPPRPPAGRTLRQEIILEPHGKRWLFGLDQPLRMNVDGVRTRAGMLLARNRILHPQRYAVISSPGEVLPVPLGRAERRRNLRLPIGAAPRTVRLARQWRATAADDEALIRQALDYYTRNLRYTLSPGATPAGADPTDHFLFTSRAGFCEHMAGGFAVLMRAAGIPARVVTGYQGGAWNELGGFLQVRQSDAHAWTEVWLENRGWVRIDPTAAVAPERVERGLAAAPGLAAELPLLSRVRLGSGLLGAAQQFWDTLNYQWQRWVLAYGPDRQWALLRLLGLSHPDWRDLAWMLGGVLGILAVLATLWGLRGARGMHRDPVRRSWAVLERKLARAGLPARASETPLQLARRAARTWPAQAAILHDIAQSYTRIRYAHCADPVGGAAVLRRRIRALRLRRVRPRCGDTSGGADDCDPAGGRPPEPPGDWRNRPG